MSDNNMKKKIALTKEYFINHYGSDNPILSDKRKITVVNEIINDIPIVSELERYEFRVRSYAQYSNFKFWNKTSDGIVRCFITGQKLYYVYVKIRTKPHWVVTTDHLLPKFSQTINDDWNLFPVSYYMNKKMSHIPLLIKMYVREKFKELDFDRDDCLVDKNIILKHYLDILEPFLYNGSLAFYPHCYDTNQFQPLWNAMNEYEQRFINDHNVINQPLDVDVLSIYNQCLIQGNENI